jgi:hypothetical protein
MNIKFEIGDIIELPKSHPCGGKRWIVLYVGVDMKLKCEKCGHIVVIPRIKIKTKAKKVGKIEIESMETKF